MSRSTYLISFVTLIVFAQINCNSQNSILWEKTYNIDGNPQLMTYLDNKKEFIILGGKYNKIDSVETYNVLVKTDNTGNVLKEKFCGENNQNIRFFEKITEDKFLIMGYNNTRNLWIRIINSEFEIISDTVLSYQWNFTGQFNLAKDGNIIIAFNTNYASIKILKITEKFKIIWESEIGNEYKQKNKTINMYNYDLFIDKEGNILITGDICVNSGFNMFISKLDPNGKQIWIKDIGNWNEYIRANSIVCFGNNIYVFGMSRNQKGGAEDNFDLDLYNFSQNGELLWKNQIKGSSHEYSEQIIACGEKSLVIIGYTYSRDGIFSKNKGGQENFIFKIDLNGKILSSFIFGSKMNDNIYKITSIAS